MSSQCQEHCRTQGFQDAEPCSDLDMLDMKARRDGKKLFNALCSSGRRECNKCEERRCRDAIRNLRDLLKIVNLDELRDSFSCTPRGLCDNPDQVISGLSHKVHWCKLPACDANGADGVVSSDLVD